MFVSAFRYLLSFPTLTGWMVLCSFLTTTSPIRSSEEKQIFFENKVRPILVEHCYSCHSTEADFIEASLNLDSKKGWQDGGDSGPAIVVGQPEKSLLIEAIRYKNVDLQMPPEQKLSDDQIETLVAWIQNGAYDPRIQSADAAKSKQDEFDIERRINSQWCWQPLSQDDPPSIKDKAWPIKDLDRFILARLENAALQPAADAEKRTFIRRVTFDLIGLPPTPQEIDEFIADSSPTAYERLVDRLLESPHYGEHWAQHWLDVVRFAETRGHEQDYDIPESYRYRDYVVHAFNEDVPYNTFLTEHLAGDLVAQPRLHPENRTNQSIQGTGFWHLHEATHSPVDIQGDEADRFHNQIDVFSRSFLALSFGCARCHDHKFDPISARDYYSVYGFLQSSSYRLADVSDPPLQAELFEKLTNHRKQHLSGITQNFVSWKFDQLSRFPKLLDLAVSSAVQAIPIEAAQEGDKPVYPDALETLASEHDVPVDVLAQLVLHLREANKDIRAPLHFFSRIAMERKKETTLELDKIARQIALDIESTRTAELAKRQSMQVTKSVKDGERNYKPEKRPWSEADIVEDFRSPSSERWITDGYRYGNAPTERGEILLGTDADRPVVRVTDRTAAESNVISKKLTGFIRTKTFEITGDKLWYRYRGAGEAFLAVDSHRVVNGPLHGVVKQRLKPSTDWKWHAHPVRDYMGHRVHVEFTAKNELALDLILFGDQPLPIEKPFVDLTFVNGESPTVRSVIDKTIERFTSALTNLQSGELSDVDIDLVNWMIQHPEIMQQSQEPFDRLQTAFDDFRQEQTRLEARIPDPIRALALLDGNAEHEPVHIRGNHRNRSADAVPRKLPTALDRSSESISKTGSGRLELARKLIRPENPLVSRVIVNRIWHHLFGRGIVKSVDDFGVMGQKPTHPKLLDFLARRFTQDGWSIKSMIREIVLSRTYRMASTPNAEQDQRDAANVLWHRMEVRRMPAESIRDHILSVSGRIDKRMYGQSVRVHITPFMRGNRSPGHSGPLDGDGRRSIYTEVRRNHLSAFLTAFDKPVPFMAIGRRSVSNSPSQSLILLNDPFVHEQASLWARRLLERDDMTDRDRIANAFVSGFGRPPTPSEVNDALAFIELQGDAYKEISESDPRTRAWTDLCHTLINVKEFIHIN